MKCRQFKQKCPTAPLLYFLLSLIDKYLDTAKQSALKTLPPFTTTYLCEL